MIVCEIIPAEPTNTGIVIGIVGATWFMSIPFPILASGRKS
jgi:hypothetical protein